MENGVACKNPELSNAHWKSFRPDAQIAENLLVFAAGQAVKNDDRMHFLIECVVQALRVRRNRVLSVVRQFKLLDPVGIRRQPRRFPVFHIDLEQPHRRFVLGVIDDFGIVFLLLHLHFVQRRIFFRAVNDGVFVEPFDLLRRMREIGEVPRLASVPVDQPDLHGRCVGLRLGSRACAHESDPLAVRRPLRLHIVVGAARQRDLARIAGQTRKIEIRDAAVFIFVAGGFRPREPLTVRRDAVLPDRFAINKIFRLPRLFLRGRFCFVRARPRNVRHARKSNCPNQTDDEQTCSE